MARVRLRYFVIFLLSASVGGCGTSSETLVTPSPLSGRCGVDLTVTGTSDAADRRTVKSAFFVPVFPSTMLRSSPIAGVLPS